MATGNVRKNDRYDAYEVYREDKAWRNELLPAERIRVGTLWDEEEAQLFDQLVNPNLTEADLRNGRSIRKIGVIVMDGMVFYDTMHDPLPPELLAETALEAAVLLQAREAFAKAAAEQAA